ncbi:MAG: hypothetical protein WCD60_25570, partial [Pseudolabrys sp.]
NTAALANIVIVVGPWPPPRLLFARTRVRVVVSVALATTRSEVWTDSQLATVMEAARYLPVEKRDLT